MYLFCIFKAFLYKIETFCPTLHHFAPPKSLLFILKCVNYELKNNLFYSVKWGKNTIVCKE